MSLIVFVFPKRSQYAYKDYKTVTKVFVRLRPYRLTHEVISIRSTKAFHHRKTALGVGAPWAVFF